MPDPHTVAVTRERESGLWRCIENSSIGHSEGASEYTCFVPSAGTSAELPITDSQQVSLLVAITVERPACLSAPNLCPSARALCVSHNAFARRAGLHRAAPGGFIRRKCIVISARNRATGRESTSALISGCEGRRKAARQRVAVAQRRVSLQFNGNQAGFPVAAGTAVWCVVLCSVDSLLCKTCWFSVSDSVSAWFPTLSPHQQRCCAFDKAFFTG